MESAEKAAINRLRVTVYSVRKKAGRADDPIPAANIFVGEFDDGGGPKKLLAEKPQTLGALIAKKVRFGVLTENIVIVSIQKGEAEDPSEAARGAERVALDPDELNGIHKAMMEERVNVTGVIPIIRSP
ncbi:MAG: hypothetical protein V1827_01475 [Candidatus Micrarchaeota archaeon]